MLSEARAASPLNLADGGGPARRRAAALDAALADLAGAASAALVGTAVVAVGGYGRGELSPHSDVDLLLVPDGRGGAAGDELTRALLYPLWDAGFQVGHAVRAPKEALEFARRDLPAATALLSARLVAGDAAVFEELLARRRRWVERERRGLARRILDATAARHRQVERAGWALAPDLKHDVGGLRDLHALAWLEALAGQPASVDGLAAAGELLLAVREALHARTPRKLDRVRLDLQPALAADLGIDGEDAADRLMAEVHTAARTVEHATGSATQELAGRIMGGPRRSGLVRRLAPGVRVEDGVLVADEGPGPDDDELAWALRLLAVRAARGRPVAPATVAWLRRVLASGTNRPWSPAARTAFAELLAGPDAAAACELLDHVGGWVALLPEWAGVRGRAQHDPWHRYTVDGHAFVTLTTLTRLRADDPEVRHALAPVGGSGGLESEAGTRFVGVHLEPSGSPPVDHGGSSLDTLYLAALLHDVGKGSGSDHSLAGERLARQVAVRMGLAAEATEEVATLVRWHLLLVEAATRRDLDDPAVAGGVAERLGSARRLRLLYALTVADALATGPQAWSSWKSALVGELYRKALAVLEGSAPADDGGPDQAALAAELEAREPVLAGQAGRLLATFPASYASATPVAEMVDELRLVLAQPGPGEVGIRVDGDAGEGLAAVTVCATDRPGTLARTAGVLAMHRMSVRQAQAWSTSDGLALERFLVQQPAEPRWDRLLDDLRAAHAGQLAVEARLARKARDYRAALPAPPEVRVLPDASEHATVVEVRARDALGLLYAVAAALGDLDLDIRIAKIDTLGERVVDVFYVRTSWGAKLGKEHADEVPLAVSHRIARFFGT
ncbi:MAG TPA: HD domain-containing protein [Actinomycetes bacterium]